MNKSNILNFLGLAMRAGKVKSGESVILTEIKKRKTSLVILSEDASSRTTKEISQKCESYHVPLRILGTREELGQALGKSSRVNIAIMDNGFAKKLLSMIDE